MPILRSYAPGNLVSYLTSLAGGGGAPSGPAGGDAAGTYPNITVPALVRQAVYPGYKGGTDSITTAFNADGSITETYANGLVKTTVMNANGSITESFSGLFTQTKTTTFTATGYRESIT